MDVCDFGFKQNNIFEAVGCCLGGNTLASLLTHLLSDIKK